jgi:hypothetical protein
VGRKRVGGGMENEVGVRVGFKFEGEGERAGWGEMWQR